MSTALDLAKGAVELAQAVKNMELYRKLVDLQAAVVAQQSQIVELTESNNTWRQKLKDAEDALALKARLKYDPPVYFAEGDLQPICPTCWESKRQAIHLIFIELTGYHQCNVCANALDLRKRNR